MDTLIRYTPSFSSSQLVRIKHWLMSWKPNSKKVLRLKDLTPVTHSSLLAIGYEAAEAEFIWEALCHDLAASYHQQWLLIQQDEIRALQEDQSIK